jgi:hypothetical protein
LIAAERSATSSVTVTVAPASTLFGGVTFKLRSSTALAGAAQRNTNVPNMTDIASAFPRVITTLLKIFVPFPSSLPTAI